MRVAFLVTVASSSAFAAPSISAKQVLSARSPTAWFGSSAIARPTGDAAGAPVFLASTWVYPPDEVIGYGINGSRLWVKNTTADLTFQTLYVSAPGEAPAKAGGVDALAFWNLKPSGIDGTCVLLGFNSAVGPDVDLGPSRPGSSWHANLTSDCSNVNLAVPWSRFTLSDDGSTAVAWTQDAAGDITVYAFEGQTGQLRWQKKFPCGTPDECNYYLSYGCDVSGDGRWVVYDDGVEGAGAHKLHVLAAADGAPRAVVLSPDAVPAHASPDGTFMFSSDDADAPSTGAFSTWRWSAAAAAYTLAGSALPPLGSGGDGWTLAQYAFSTDERNRTWLGVVWFDTGLLGPSVLALYDAAAPASGPVSWVATTPLAGSSMANAGAVVDCAGSMCAAGFYVQKVGAPQPSLVVVAADAPATVWNFTTPGSVDAVSVSRSGKPGSYYVLAAGCTSPGVCTVPGGDLYAFEVTVTAT